MNALFNSPRQNILARAQMVGIEPMPSFRANTGVYHLDRSKFHQQCSTSCYIYLDFFFKFIFSLKTRKSRFYFSFLKEKNPWQFLLHVASQFLEEIFLNLPYVFFITCSMAISFPIKTITFFCLSKYGIFTFLTRHFYY